MRMWRYGSRGSNVPRPTRPSPTPFSRTSSEGDRLPSEEKLAERISGLRDQAVEQEARQFGAFANTARNSPQTVNCVVVDAAPIEPVSSVEIPRKLGKYWEFRSFWTLRGPNRRAVSKACRQNSHARELGIYFKEMGKRKTEKRNKRKTGKRKTQRCSNGDKSVCCF